MKKKNPIIEIKGNTITIKANQMKHKMDGEELEGHLKLKRGNGAHRNKKAYNRKPKYQEKTI